MTPRSHPVGGPVPDRKSAADSACGWPRPCTFEVVARTCCGFAHRAGPSRKTRKVAGADYASPAVSADTEMTVNSREAGALAVATPVTTPPEASRIHLLYLEGIRG